MSHLVGMILLLLSMLIQPLSPGHRGPEAAATPIRCEVAMQAVHDVTSTRHKKTIVFSAALPILGKMGIRSLGQEWRIYSDGKQVSVPAPSKDLATRFMSPQGNAVASCATIRQWLLKHQFRYGKRALRAIVPNRYDELPVGIITVGLPVVNEEGDTALVYTEGVWGGLDASGSAELYRKVDGAWKHVVVKDFGSPEPSASVTPTSAFDPLRTFELAR